MKVLLMGCLLLGMITVAHAEEGKVYGDFDLESHKQDSKIERRGSFEPVNNIVTKAKSNEMEAQIWCDKGQAARDRIAFAQQNVNNAADAERSSRTVLYNRGAVVIASSDAAAIAATNAISELNEAKRALQRLEEAAHSQGKPAGWLNCNY